MDLRQVKDFVDLMKDIDSRNNLKESAKSLLPYMEWLIEQAEKVERIEEEIRGKWSTETVSVNRLYQLLKKG